MVAVFLPTTLALLGRIVDDREDDDCEDSLCTCCLLLLDASDASGDGQVVVLLVLLTHLLLEGASYLNWSTRKSIDEHGSGSPEAWEHGLSNKDVLEESLVTNFFTDFDGC